MHLIFLNNKFISEKKAKVSVFDRGFQYGDGVFETMRSYDGNIFMLERHVERLLTSLKIMQIKMPYKKNKLTALVNKTLNLSKLKNAYIKLIVTRGIANSGINITKTISPTLIIYAKPLKKISMKIYRNGLKVNFACIDKCGKSFIAKIKSLNYVDNILAKDEARRGGFDDALFVNTKGNVSEATTSNIFMVGGGRILTPPPTAGLLPGITRGVVIDIIKKYLGNKIDEKDIRPKVLGAADEIFLTSSIHEVIPVVKLGRIKIGNGKPGKFTKLIHALYKKEVES